MVTCEKMSFPAVDEPMMTSLRHRLKLSKDIPEGIYTEALYLSSDHNPANEIRFELKYEISNQLLVGGLFIEENDRVNVRMFPSLDATILFGLEQGDAITCVGLFTYIC